MPHHMVQLYLEFPCQNQLGKEILNIVDNYFPKKHPLRKICNRHTLKLSYSRMSNMKSIIASYKKTVPSNYMSTLAAELLKCNCRKKEQWLLEVKCLTNNNVLYQVPVTTSTTTETYVGLAANNTDITHHPFETTINRIRPNYPSTFEHLKTQINPSTSNAWRILRKC